MKDRKRCRNVKYSGDEISYSACMDHTHLPNNLTGAPLSLIVDVVKILPRKIIESTSKGFVPIDLI